MNDQAFVCVCLCFSFYRYLLTRIQHIYIYVHSKRDTHTVPLLRLNLSLSFQQDLYYCSVPVWQLYACGLKFTTVYSIKSSMFHWNYRRAVCPKKKWIFISVFFLLEFFPWISFFFLFFFCMCKCHTNWNCTFCASNVSKCTSVISESLSSRSFIL